MKVVYERIKVIKKLIKTYRKTGLSERLKQFIAEFTKNIFTIAAMAEKKSHLNLLNTY